MHVTPWVFNAVAIAVLLSTLSANEVIDAIARGDVSLLKSVKGIGLKSAQRIIIDLKGKLDMSEDENSFSMTNCITSMVLKKEGDKLIYIYDFFSMWTFFVELTEIIDEINEDLPLIALSFGNTPDEAPEKQFIGEDTEKDDYDAFDDESNFEDLDNIDLDNY